MTITIELLKEEALPLLRNLERLHILQVVQNEKKPARKTARNGKSLLGKDQLPAEQVGKAEAPVLTSSSAIRPLRKTLTLEELLAEQKFKGFDRLELDKLIADINVQEPIEELMAMLRA